jgi:SAM-dependent methyltransferase
MSKVFWFNNQELVYFSHPYNRAGQNMRTVEVPIARAFLHDREWDRILEIGNVLSHYGRINWPVLDAQEKGPGVINADLMAWHPERPYDRIVSISTLEHIGHGRYAHLTAATTPAEALSRVRTWLAPGGEALLTVPARYNEALDRQLVDGLIPADDIRCMKRVSPANEWAECTLTEALNAKRPEGYQWAVGMVALHCTQEGQLKTLNLGAGKKPIEGAVNHDLSLDPKRPYITVAHDLNVIPWPWANRSFDRIVARSVFEHLNIDLVACLDECWRILRKGGYLYLKVPYWKSDIAHRDVTHRWYFTLGSFAQFDPDKKRGKEYSFYTERRWKIIKGPFMNDARSSIHITMEVRK